MNTASLPWNINEHVQIVFMSELQGEFIRYQYILSKRSRKNSRSLGNERESRNACKGRWLAVMKESSKGWMPLSM